MYNRKMCTGENMKYYWLEQSFELMPYIIGGLVLFLIFFFFFFFFFFIFSNLNYFFTFMALPNHKKK